MEYGTWQARRITENASFHSKWDGTTTSPDPSTPFSPSPLKGVGVEPVERNSTRRDTRHGNREITRPDLNPLDFHPSFLIRGTIFQNGSLSGQWLRDIQDAQASRVSEGGRGCEAGFETGFFLARSTRNRPANQIFM
jgi:hypothetical protein